jgi:lipid-A-disaccharide synthase
MPVCGAILFTAFEPSGDEHAAHVIAELRRRHPHLPIYAWGGPRMQAAGALLVERTGDHAVMGLPGLAKIREHARINERVARFLAEHPVAVHVPVDSPAANFPLCKITRRAGCRVVHLVAPQIWAWGRWRIHKLRRLTDLVLCLLPFEERFFLRRRVPARFIGHMLFDQPLDEAALDRIAADFPAGPVRLAFMPGSRPAEFRRNFPLILRVFRGLRAHYPDAVGVIAATTPAVENELRRIAERHGGWPQGLASTAGNADAAIRWCTLALVKSGTVTLQVARQLRPMVIFYKHSNPVFYYALSRLILATRRFSLPNVIAMRTVVPEFVPHFGGPDPIIQAARRLIDDPEARRRQQADLADVLARFHGRHASALAADAIQAAAGLSPQPLPTIPAVTPQVQT